MLMIIYFIPFQGVSSVESFMQKVYVEVDEVASSHLYRFSRI